MGVNLEKVNTSGSSNEVTINLNVGLDYNDLELPSEWCLFKEYENVQNAPELDEGMIAVKYENNNWMKADVNNINSDEWSIVAYLSQSKYGKLGNENFSGVNKEIYQNKSNSYITGCSYGHPSDNVSDYVCQYTYDIDINRTGASTTGTIYGIYDMSGGSHEYVMTNYNDILGNSGKIL